MKLYIILFTHKHGTDVWPHFAPTEPSEGEVIEGLRAEGSWDGDDDRGDSHVEIRGPFAFPNGSTK